MKGWWCVRYGDALAWVEAPSEATVRPMMSMFTPSTMGIRRSTVVTVVSSPAARSTTATGRMTATRSTLRYRREPPVRRRRSADSAAVRFPIASEAGRILERPPSERGPREREHAVIADGHRYREQSHRGREQCGHLDREAALSGVHRARGDELVVAGDELEQSVRTLAEVQSSPWTRPVVCAPGATGVATSRSPSSERRPTGCWRDTWPATRIGR